MEDGLVTPAAVAAVRRQLGWKFPPPKSHFGSIPDSYFVEGWGKIWKSSEPGGLTRFWGASALPLPDREFERWPFPASAIRPHYEAIVKAIPVSGSDDCFSAIWSRGLASRPPLQPAGLLQKLTAMAVELSGTADGYDIQIGSGRVAVETDPDSAKSCQLLGQCMIGCPRDAVYSAGNDVNRARERAVITRSIPGRVLAYNSLNKTLDIESGGRKLLFGPFDLIFLAAGCVGSTAIVLRSRDDIASLPLQDNAIYTFPLFHFGRARQKHPEQYFGLTNLVCACRPESGGPTSLIQMYPFFDYLWQYYLPSFLWPLGRRLAKRMREHAAICRLYVPAEHSQRYTMSVDPDGEPRFTLDRAPVGVKAIPGLWNAVRRRLSHGNYWVPNIISAQRTSSHYAATLPMGSRYCDRNARVADGIYLCDSAAFPSSPAFSPTLTIMAFARKVVMEAIETTMAA